MGRNEETMVTDPITNFGTYDSDLPVQIYDRSQFNVNLSGLHLADHSAVLFNQQQWSENLVELRLLEPWYDGE